MIKKGTKLKCVLARDIPGLLVGNIYTAMYNEHPGIFKDRQHITIKNDDGRLATYYSYRFEVQHD